MESENIIVSAETLDQYRASHGKWVKIGHTLPAYVDDGEPFLGRPRIHNRDEVLVAFNQYIAQTSIPIVAEFASQQGVSRNFLYDNEEFRDAINRCIFKKEAALERQALNGDVNVTMAIFSLKQLGWTDRTEQTVQGKGGGPIVISNTDAEL